MERERMSNWSNAGSSWTKGEEKYLVELKLISNRKFDEISTILKRSPRAIKLRFSEIIDDIDWQGITASVPAEANPMDEIVLLILAGSTPADVALQFPKQFLDNHSGIKALWEHHHRKQWRYTS